MQKETLRDLFIEQLHDIYDAEQQLVKALPKFAQSAESADLAQGLRDHLAETQNQVSRLEQIFQILGVKAEGKTCKGMKGLLQEGTESADQESQGYLRDLAIIAGAQRVEHYEISAYGTARALAERLSLADVADLLEQTQDEEEQADSTLTDVAESIYETADEPEVAISGSSAKGRESSSRKK